MSEPTRSTLPVWLLPFMVPEHVESARNWLQDIVDESDNTTDITRYNQKRLEWTISLVTALSNSFVHKLHDFVSAAQIRELDTKAWSAWLNSGNKLPATSYDTWIAACAYKSQQICLSDIEQQNYDLRAENEILKERLNTFDQINPLIGPKAFGREPSIRKCLIDHYFKVYPLSQAKMLTDHYLREIRNPTG